VSIIRNQQVAGSIPAGGSSISLPSLHLRRFQKFLKSLTLRTVPIFVPTPFLGWLAPHRSLHPAQ
jgi:hypothetical protein